MLSAIHCSTAALDAIAPEFRAGIAGATLADNIHHALFSVLPAVRRGLAAFEIKSRTPRAGLVEAKAHVLEKPVTVVEPLVWRSSGKWPGQANTVLSCAGLLFVHPAAKRNNNRWRGFLKRESSAVWLQQCGLHTVHIAALQPNHCNDSHTQRLPEKRF